MYIKKLKLAYRRKKIRGKKKKFRSMVKISDITSEGFRLQTYNRNYYIPRDRYYWFKYANARQISCVMLDHAVPGDPTQAWDYDIRRIADDGHIIYMEGPDHGDILYWPFLQLDVGSNIFEYPDFFDPSFDAELVESRFRSGESSERCLIKNFMKRDKQ